MKTNVQQQKVVEGLCGGGKRGERMIKGHEGVLGSDGCVHYLACGESQVMGLALRWE